MTLKVLREFGKKNSKRYKRSLNVIPHIFTFTNAFFGFFSVVNVLEENLQVAAYCLIIAACMDIVDGCLARIFKSNSYFGAELDTVCDAISFCLAPAILLYSFYGVHYGSLGIIILTLYLCAGLFRLARFNSSSTGHHYFFIGLPSTAAAFFVASLVMYHDWISASYLGWLTTQYGTMSSTVLIALLMVSTIHYPSWKRVRIRFFHFWAIVVPCLGIISFCITYNYPVFFLMVFSYIGAGLLVGIFTGAKRLLASIV